MAEHLASIFGTEKDKVHCSFYHKIGSCRHGDRCSRRHVKPTYSQTILVSNMYKNPSLKPDCTLSEEEIQRGFEDFYEDMFIELAKYGEIEELKVCDNVGDHLLGNVYVKYRKEDDAQKAVDSLNNRYYAGLPVWAELSPVTDFREACCRQYDTSECNRGGYCNFMHIRKPARSLVRELFDGQELTIREMRRVEREKRLAREHKTPSRTPSPRSPRHHRSRSPNY
ncbi:hypothetical protein LPJ78_000585 [Coemansia sp. RSA 989]|nr:splicing factor U2AF 26 kDa subunit [Coemansia mojavensis]KAJ1744217.1 hypothetical protein LPJ68_000277 [Coemansia sp. RSA 1086]KAJ1750270.1 hypothetical protein LPJ79_003033 [Coemansia sp. RSA 1821]KAJ1867886.1 hypothetical protein LPJ78_000585 [Coemansia sp. RSA 989]KAJ1874439.1 hypothetical protein LPJ55_001438 [Coemansia sp. RSA 990]KAJ2653134.1 hypothetical protein IWW40_000788 [Coemansia sp. RSA 1250]KAJ2676134.1 hypothetical protein IWW42_000803 [Coemansia sp. RSA 1085]